MTGRGRDFARGCGMIREGYVGVCSSKGGHRIEGRLEWNCITQTGYAIGGDYSRRITGYGIGREG